MLLELIHLEKSLLQNTIFNVNCTLLTGGAMVKLQALYAMKKWLMWQML